ncbi:MAG TPA: phytochelatin synthase family protein [Stellaceae bacterium]|nr:phytochelatin synthase family protein [Stellaceae bacterium]
MRRLLLALLLLAWTAPAVRADDVVYLPSDIGAARFQSSPIQPSSLALLAYTESEERQTFCGPASLAAALNSLGIRNPTPAPLFPYHLITQDSVFTKENEGVKSYSAVEHEGMTLDELAKFAANLGTSTEVIHAQDMAIDALRAKLRDALDASGKRVLANYSRKPLGQVGDGHISPLAAYDAQTDSFLILDVAKYKYPPAWVSFKKLYEGMLLVDSSSGLSRGVVILSASGVRSPQ